MAKGNGKGSGFEREVCKQLSVWWTLGERDDIFWRSSQSGGRATTRRKQGKSTANSCGDISYIDADGLALIALCTLELKRGYKKWSILDSIDTKYRVATKIKTSIFEKFLDQVENDRELAGSRWCMLITKRDAKQSIMTISRELFIKLSEYSDVPDTKTITFSRDEDHKYVSMSLEEFFNWANVQFFRDFHKENM